MARHFEIGLMFQCKNAPELLIPYVQATENSGLDEIWIVEDCFFGGAIASVTAALATTKQIRVGLGIMPAVARNPAFVAMEIATLARLYPGRFLPGFGHGVGEWMKQIGAFPSSQLAALEETTRTVRQLLAGEQVTFDGKHVHLRDVALEFPPDAVPPVLLGVRGPKSLQLSGRVADGTILAEFASSAYVEWAREQIGVGQHEVGQQGQAHHLTVYAYFAMDDDRQAALDKVRPVLAQGIVSGHLSVYLEPLGILDEANKLIAGGLEMIQREMPDEWIDQLAIVGTPEECARGVRRFADAGADSVVLVAVDDSPETPTVLAEKLMPLLMS